MNQTIDKWIKVRDALAAAGKTNSPFYLRALTIIQTGRDPEDKEPPISK